MSGITVEEFLKTLCERAEREQISWEGKVKKVPVEFLKYELIAKVIAHENRRKEVEMLKEQIDFIEKEIESRLD